MAYYGRKRSSRRYSSNKKYGKKYGRKRYSKKKFYKNGINQLTMKAPLASRLLRVKLPWVKVFNPTVGTSNSQFYAFFGSSLFPYLASAQTHTNTNPVFTTGDSLPAGALEYSQFYDKYYINGSSIKIEAMSTNSQALAISPLVRAVLIAIPYINIADPTGGLNTNDSFASVRDQLNGYSYEQLLSWPYAKWRMLGSNTGGSSRLVFKTFRKTKNMSGIKDLRDNSDFSGHLTDGLSTLPSSSTTNLLPINGFMYFLKFFNQDETTTANLAITVRMSLYCTLVNREFNPVTSVTIE